ncbi:MAG: tandem-95 repeat protein [Phycisphaerales bacterium]|nr:MAG: tandem-95 repeat protein [Phycisphaerales bacterium]
MMESVKKISRGRYWRKGVIYFLTWCLIVNTSVLAAPSGGVFTVGTGAIEYGANTAVTVDQAQSIIEWGAPGSGGIDTMAGEALTFSQAGGLTDSAVLNRIMSGNTTQFDGTLSGTDMRIFIVNPAGIVFGKGATVNVSQLIASGLNMSDVDFLNATGDSSVDLRFEGGDGVVTNHALIQANEVFLVGKKVINDYGIVTPDGLAVMAAGDNVYIAQDGSSVVVQLDADPGDTLPDVHNHHTIRASNGTVVLAAGDIYSRAVLNDGFIEAEGGTVAVRAARVENMGEINVDADTSHAVDKDGDGGSITLTGIEEVVLTQGTTPIATAATANAGVNGNGGSITVESEGTVTLGDGTLVSARGGNESGDGGSVKITAEHFLIAGEIDASPGNTDYEPGTLEIDPATVTIAGGPNPATLEPPEEPALDTLYEQDIETWGSKGTSLVVYADDSIIVQDILDGEIKGRYGNIELYATGADSSISFDDTADTISTTLGNIMMTAGSNGLTIGSLETAKDTSNEKPTPGQIALSTHNGGDITTENLTIKSGWGRAEINVDAMGDLTVNGDVIVGGDSAIHNVPNGQDAEAMIYLKAGDDIVLGGNVQANTHGIHEDIEGNLTQSYIGIFSGTDNPILGNTTINGDLTAMAKASSNGTSEATIEIDAWGQITWGPEADPPYADADRVSVIAEDYTSIEDSSPSGDVARVIIGAQGNMPDELLGLPDLASTHMGSPVGGNVLDNDFDPEGDPLTAALVDGPGHAASPDSFTLNEDGSYSYTPEAGYVGTDTFTYTATDGTNTTDPVTVTITMTNTLPLAEGEAPTTHMNTPVAGTILDNISDADGDPLTTALVIDVEHGTLTLNPDGTYTYEPEAGYVGSDSFTFSATDGQIDAEPVEAIVTIAMTNTPPIAGNDAAETTQGVAVIINVLANDSDPDGDPLTAALVGGPASGTLTQSPDGTFTYTPAQGFVGQDSFTYSPSDGQVGAEPILATVSITVGSTLVPLSSPAAPGLERVEFELSGCPALVQWAAQELEVRAMTVEIRIANALALTRDIQPCDMCASLKQAATILQDVDGTYIAALAQVINESASAAAPPTEEQMASIADTIARNAEDENHYAVAGEYLDAIAEYVGILAGEIGFSPQEAVQFVTDKYIGRLAETGNAGAAAMAARLAALAAQ